MYKRQQDASIALIGQAVGAHRRDMAKRFAWLCTMMGIGIMALSGVGLWLFAPALMGIFTADAAVIALGLSLIHILRRTPAPPAGRRTGGRT